MHITIQEGRSLPKLQRCTTCCKQFHCPFCRAALFRPTKLSKIRIHLKSHFNRAVHHEGYSIHRCGLNCRPHWHYHCIHCQATVSRKTDFIRHLSLCKNKYAAINLAIPAPTTSTVPAPTTSTVPAPTTSTVPAPTTSTVLAVTGLPATLDQRDQWLAALNKKTGDGGKYLVLCSRYLITGKPSKDESHPGPVPSILPQKSETSPRSQCAASRKYRCLASLKELSPNIAPCQATVNESTSDVSRDFETSIENGSADAEEQRPDNSCPECAGTQVHTAQLEREMKLLRAERDAAQARVIQLERQLDGTNLSASSILGDDEKCLFFTGLPLKVFEKTFTFLVKYVFHGQTKDSLSYIDQFFLTLVRLRLDLSFKFLGYQTGIPELTLQDYFWCWVDLIHVKLAFMLQWPSRDSIVATLPCSFQSKFPRLTSIIDCFEVFIEQPNNLHARACVYSNSKKHATVKVFVACTPLGAVCFLSSAWGGCVSDAELVRSCGFITSDLHMPGDQILADRDFLLHDDFATVCSAELITPAFTRGNKLLSAREVEPSRAVSSVRRHVERVIGVLKNRYHILSNTLPIHVVKFLTDEKEGKELASIDRLLQACAILMNLGDSIVLQD